MDNKDLEEMLEEIKKTEKINKGFIFRLHNKFEYHLLILYIINILSIIVSISISYILKEELITYTLISLLIFITLATLFEIIIKILLYRHLYLISIFTFGIIPYILQLTIFYLTSLIITNIEFVFIKGLIIFTLIFIIIRILLIIITRRYTMKGRI